MLQSRDGLNITKVFGWEYLEDIPTHRLRELMNITIGSADEGVLKSWETHLRGIFKGVQLKATYKKPYIITISGKIKTLWVE
jgi:hypothetical protein